MRLELKTINTQNKRTFTDFKKFIHLSIKINANLSVLSLEPTFWNRSQIFKIQLRQINIYKGFSNANNEWIQKRL